MIEEDRVSRVRLRIPQEEGKTVGHAGSEGADCSHKYVDGSVEMEVAAELVVRKVREWIL